MLTNQSLKSYNSFGVDAIARQLFYLKNIKDYCSFSELEGKSIILGSGSNILLLNSSYDNVGILQIDDDPTVIHNDKEKTIIQVESGYLRDQFVQWTLDHGYNGLENMGLIPGTIGAGALGNIGAYGREICEFIDEVDYLDLQTKTVKTLSNYECQYSYRRSVFKSMSDYIIISVRFIFHKQTKTLNTKYPDIEQYLTDHSIESETLAAKQLYEIICRIRRDKMPSRNEWGTAGSFRKNPIVHANELERLSIIDPHLKYFAHGNQFKLAAGRLLENLGYKGKTVHMPSGGSVGCYHNQALLVVNNGCTGKEIDEFARSCEESVYELYGIRLEREVIALA